MSEPIPLESAAPLSKSETLRANWASFEYKPYSDDELASYGVSEVVSKLQSRSGSIFTREVFRPYWVARADVVKNATPESGPMLESKFSDGGLATPDLEDSNTIDSRLLAYFTTEKQYHQNKAIKIRKAGGMPNEEESLATKYDIASRVLTGEAHELTSNNVLIQVTENMQSRLAAAKVPGGPKNAEIDVMSAYLEKVIDNIKLRYPSQS